jgi:uncharacterized membrane protein
VKKGETKMAKVEVSVVINRPVEEVFTFMRDIKNWLKWQSGMLEAEQSSEGPVGVGTTYQGVNEFLGRRMEWTSEIIAFEQDKLVEQRIKSGPMLLEQFVKFEPVEGGTKLTLGGEGETGGLFKLAEPMVNRRMQKEMEGNISNLKDILEAQV